MQKQDEHFADRLDEGLHEQAMRLREQEHLRFLVENVSGHFLVLEAEEGRVLHASTSFLKAMRYAEGEVRGRPLYTLIHEQDRAKLPAAARDLPAFTETAPGWLARFRSGDDAWHYLQGQVRDLRDDPRIEGLLLHLRALQERDAAERPVAAEAQLLLRAIEAANNSVVVADYRKPDLPLVYANEGFQQLTQYDQDEILGRNCRFLQRRPDGTQDDDQPGLDDIRQALENGAQTRATIRNYRKDGSMFWNELYLTPVPDASGRITHVIGVQNDVTELQEAQQRLKEREETLFSFYDSAPVMMGVLERRDGRVTHLTDNRAARAFFGMTEAEMRGRTDRELGFDAFCDGEWVEAYDRAEATGEVVTFACAFPAAEDGSRAERALSITVNFIGEQPDGTRRLSYIARDVTEERQSETERRLLGAAVENADESLVITEAEIEPPGPRILYVNPAFTRLTGYAQDEIVGETPRILQGPRTDRAVLDRLRRDLAAQQSFRGETVNYRKDGSAYVVEWHIAPIRDEDGEVRHWVATQRDMTRRREAETEVRRLNLKLEERVQERTAALQEKNRELEEEISERRLAEAALTEAKEAAEAANLAKSAFLANMSHEIRTPLTAVLGFAALLARQVSGQQRTFAERIERSGNRLMETLNLVLDLARLDANRVRVELEVLNVADEVREIVQLFQPRARGKGLTLKVHVEPEAEQARARLDPGALSSIMNNLIGNAIKFTERGHVTVNVGVTSESTGWKNGATATRDATPRVFIRIEDTGVGISQAFLPSLFDEFMQESVGEERAYEGSGLGLAITKRLIDLMHGHIDVTSEKGQGSIFTLSFETAADTPSQTPSGASAPAPEPRPAPGRPRVLLVEDNEDTQFLMQSLLEDLCEVVTASNAEQALEAARQQACALVLLDINLGEGRTGVDVLKDLRRLPAYQHVPIVALTAYALPGDRERFLQTGFDYYLAKPFTVEELMDLLTEVLPA